jgi:outer membrane protein assembly factor BamB
MRNAKFAVLSLGLMVAVALVSACQKEKAPAVSNPARTTAPEVAVLTGGVLPPDGETRPTITPLVAASQPAGGSAWPCFRGVDAGNATANGGDPPVAITDKDVLYKADVPVSGQSSPIVWGDRVYLSGNEDHIMAYNRTTGTLVWDVQLRTEAAASQPAAPEGGAPGEQFEVNRDTGLAAPTPVTDGNRIYASFGSGVIGCVDRTGKQVWAKRLTPGQIKNTYGMASSPVMYGDTVIQQVDQGMNPDAGLSFLVAYATKDGTEKWRKARPTVSGWSSPILVKLPEGDTLITSGAPLVTAYDPKTGAERWSCEGVMGEVAASPIFCGGVVIAPSSYSGGSLLAVKPGGKGDVSKTHVAWSSDAPSPDFPSPAGDGKKCYCMSGSTMFAINAADGKEAWHLDLDGSFYSSPVFAAGRIYVISRDGTLFVVSAKGTKLAENKLDTHVDASPAIVDGKIYVRTGGELWCIGKATAAPAAPAKGK